MTCQEGETKWGFLCFKKQQTCESIGYQNCGPAACSLDASNCARVVADMVIQTLIGLSKFALLFVAPGAANILEAGVDLISIGSQLKHMVERMLESKLLLVNSYQNPKLKDRMLKAAFHYLKDNNYNVIGGIMIEDSDLLLRVQTKFDQQVNKVVAEQAELAKQKVIGAVNATVAGVISSVVKDKAV